MVVAVGSPDAVAAVDDDDVDADDDGDDGEDDDDDNDDDDDVDVTSDEGGNLAHTNTGLLRVRRPDDSDEDSEDTDLEMLVGDVDTSGNEMSEGERGERLAEILAGRELERIQGFRR